MKKLSFLNKIIYLINNVLALLLLFTFAIPYIKPTSFPLISIISLAAPVIIFAHLLFIIYWLLVGFKKQVFLSTISIILTILISYFPYKFSKSSNQEDNTVTFLSYNVHTLNVYGSINKENIPTMMESFIKDNDPDIIAFQEFAIKKIDLSQFKYKYFELKKNRKFGLALYSKYKIINQGSLDFESSHNNNNGIFVDIIKQKDTVRIYNLHLESFGIKSYNVVSLDEKESKRLIRRLSRSFVKQQGQVDKFLQNKNNCKYKTIVCGDFNNTAYSWTYRKIKGDMNDSYISSGNGFGKTYSFNRYPLRIDFILSDKSFKIINHRNFDIKLSDHEPVLAEIKF